MAGDPLERARPWVCYVIEHVGCGATYVGVSPDPVRRLRQHNGEIKGGAKYTTSRPRGANGEGCWRHVCLVHGFRTSIEALQFEWAVKHCQPRGGGISARLRKLACTLCKPRWTSKSPLASDVPLVIEWRVASGDDVVDATRDVAHITHCGRSATPPAPDATDIAPTESAP